jgi:hypothetical protein
MIKVIIGNKESLIWFEMCLREEPHLCVSLAALY